MKVKLKEKNVEKQERKKNGDDKKKRSRKREIMTKNKKEGIQDLSTDKLIII